MLRTEALYRCLSTIQQACALLHMPLPFKRKCYVSGYPKNSVIFLKKVFIYPPTTDHKHVT
jgi:hypothetical protein